MCIRDRVTFDAILYSLDDIRRLPQQPRCINVKPSRFGSLRELLRVYEWCATESVACYGGGQFELGVGRRQLQALTSAFHPDAPNDVAPTDYHAPEASPKLPSSPLELLAGGRGFG